jgi:nitrogen fixation protein NifQ
LPDDEFEDVVRLLLEHRSDDSRDTRWLAHALATASMYEDHLWQDLRLPNRQMLTELLLQHFTMLALRNVANMRWKKLFYKQSCEQAEISICRSPVCSTCCDYHLCFGPEERQCWSRRAISERQ